MRHSGMFGAKDKSRDGYKKEREVIRLRLTGANGMNELPESFE